MNKFFKYTFIALLGVLTLGLSSCTDEYEYTPTSKTELGGNAFLVSEGSTAISYLPTAEQSFTFKVSRVDSTEAQTVGLSSSNEKFTVPATVSFAAGQKTAEVKVSFDIATGTSEKTRIAITDAEKYYYAATVLDYTITRYQAYSGTYVANGLGFEIQTPRSLDFKTKTISYVCTTVSLVTCDGIIEHGCSIVILLCISDGDTSFL